MPHDDPHEDIERITADALPDIVYLVDVEEQRNVFVNKSVSTVLLYSAEDIAEMGSDLFPTIIHPDDLPRVGEHYEKLAKIEDGAVLTIEYRVRRKDGVYLWYRSTDSIYTRNADKSPKLLLGSAFDITPLKNREETIKLLNEELAHRVQNLFAVTLAMLRMVRRKGGNIEQELTMLERRIAALGAMHGRVRFSVQAPETDLADLVNSFLVAACPEMQVRLEIDHVPISRHMVTSLSVILFEIFTRAHQMQDSSDPAQTPLLTASLEGGFATLRWVEDGKPMSFEDEDGQASLKLLRYASEALDGVFEHHYAPNKLQIKLTFPVM